MDFIVKYWIEALFGGLVFAVSSLSALLYKKWKRDTEEQEILKQGVLAILEDRLYQKCQYHISVKFIGVNDRENLESLYMSYNALGGNGTGTDLYNECRSLPYCI